MSDVVEEQEQQKDVGSVEEAEVESTPLYALLFELETLAANGRRSTFEALTSILNEQKIDFNQVHFARYCLHPSPDQYIEHLLERLDAKKLDPAKLAEDINNGVAMYLSSKESTLNPLIEKAVRYAEEKSIPMGAISALPESAGKALMKRLDLEERGVRLFSFDARDDAFPRADAWLKIAKAISTSPRNCIALVSSMVSCKSALSAGMRCIALPDEFTSFQDFGGSDAVYDADAEFEVEDLFQMAFPEEG